MWLDGRIPGVGGSGVVVAGANDSLRYWLGTRLLSPVVE